MAFDDLRQYLSELQKRNLLITLEGVDPAEIGALTEIVLTRAKDPYEKPLIHFKNIQGYSQDYSLLSELTALNSVFRNAIGYPPNVRGIDLVSGIRSKLKTHAPIPPREVSTAPVMQNKITGNQIDVTRFPAPKWHELDGGNYIGTADLVVTKDPDTGYVNCGTYRVQVHSKNRVTCYMSPGKHGRIIREKYWARGEKCPIALVLGLEPSLLEASGAYVGWGNTEYDYAGWLRGEAVELVKLPITGLPVPANSEIVFEGFSSPPNEESLPEGPFGENSGYYASGARNESAVAIEAVYHRDNPIVTGSLATKASVHNPWSHMLMRSAMIWDELERAGIPDIKGVYIFPSYAAGFIAVSIKQRYGGHSKHTLLQALSSKSAMYHARYVVAVDDDIDPSNMNDVIWAISTRCVPEKSIDIIRNCWSTYLDPSIEPERKAARDLTKSVALIDACRPYYWIDKYPPTAVATPKFRREVEQKWRSKIDSWLGNQ